MNRSEIFPGFYGNTRITKSLFQDAQAHRVAHTLLITGPQGSGKKTLAKKITQKLFCSKVCGECKSCKMLANGTHPDYLVIAPESNSVKLEQSRQVKSFLSTPPNTAQYKVVVLENCHQLTVEAGNSLLKVLEEPPVQSVCILTADNPDNVLPTLVSRSRVYNLAPLPNAIVSDVLVENNIPSAQAAFLSVFAGGILGRALILQDDPEFWQQRKNLAIEIQEVLAKRRDPLLSAEHWHSLPERALDLLEFWFRDMLLSQTVSGYTPGNRDLVGILEECTRSCPADKTITLLEECVQARERLSARCNSRLVFDSLLLKMWEV